MDFAGSSSGLCPSLAQARLEGGTRCSLEMGKFSRFPQNSFEKFVEVQQPWGELNTWL